MTEWRTKFRRAAIEKDNYARTKAVDSLLNFETVKYYNAESFEINRYKDAMVSYQEADWKSSVSLNILNLTQNAVITGGLLAGCLLFAWEVSQGRSTPGDFVSFNMYMMQLYTPVSCHCYFQAVFFFLPLHFQMTCVCVVNGGINFFYLFVSSSYIG
jgi:ATP-binding cassette subfamily B (MDR/TAP) protein 6